MASSQLGLANAERPFSRPGDRTHEAVRYWRSTSSYRLRIALALKGIEAEQAFVHLVRGEQHAEAYRALNPQAGYQRSFSKTERR
ncbi:MULTISPECIES: hypothetical protein [unclassified Bradyrhizobium]|uniref:hypothetical protein n=1 Tax=unclassified Bradyrhizobium TaxID=2631580 RepID=UPI001FCAA195|nr:MULTISPECIES: hypothetical protein [unclassified Bradyrhizobium]